MTTGERPRRSRTGWTLLLTVTSVAASVLVVYSAPVRTRAATADLLLFSLGLVVVAALLVLQVRRQFRAWEDPTVRVQSVLGLLSPAMALFAITYYALARDPGEFSGLESRTDALYFTVVTLGTVGYGDVHPVGDAAKVVTMVQIVFDLVVVALLVSFLTAEVRQRVVQRIERQGERGAPPGPPGPPGPPAVVDGPAPGAAGRPRPDAASP